MSQIWWSLDPGRSSGVGVWQGSELVHGRLLGNTTTGDLATAHARVVREARELAALWRPAELVAEIPHVYGQRATDPADLVALARLLGRVEEALGLVAVVVWRRAEPQLAVHSIGMTACSPAAKVPLQLNRGSTPVLFSRLLLCAGRRSTRAW